MGVAAVTDAWLVYEVLAGRSPRADAVLAAAVDRLMPAQQWIRSGALRSQSSANLTRSET